MSALIIFDDGAGEFGPMTDLRASFEIRTGMLTTAGRIARRFGRAPDGYWTPTRLVKLVASRVAVPVNELPAAETALLINGRWLLPDSSVRLKPGEALLDADGRGVMMAHLIAVHAREFLKAGELPDAIDARTAEAPAMAVHPWDVLKTLPQALPEDILCCRMLDTQVTGSGATIVGDHPVEVHQSAKVWPQVVFDATGGPIDVHDRAIIRPGAVICGPCSIGRGSTVIDHALIKPNTAIGPMCKVGGEVGATIFQGYSNKAHDGHLGDSWIGKWVNLGAATTNSNLLNTYGEVITRLEVGGQRHRTGMTFLGAIIGDHVKTAIGTRLMTGSIIGTGAMIATTAPPPTTVKRFAWLTEDGERMYRMDKFIDTMRAVMSRRGKEPGEAYLAALRALYEP